MATKPRPAKDPGKRIQKIAAISRNKQASSLLDVRDVRHRLGINRKIFSRVTGFSERAIAEWEAGKPLSESSLQRMKEVFRLQQSLAQVMQAEFVGEWLSTPNAAFDGLKPLEVIERGEIDRIWKMIYELGSGVPA